MKRLPFVWSMLASGLALGACAESPGDPNVNSAATSVDPGLCADDGTCNTNCEVDRDCSCEADGYCLPGACDMENGVSEDPDCNVDPCAEDGVCNVYDCDPGEDPDCADPGCTYTQGYWKNHNEFAKPQQKIDWPKPYDESDKLCGKTWLDILKTPPKGGNAWLILAHQWIAATLNRGNGASAPADVKAALDAGAKLLGDCDGFDAKQRSDATAAAGLLDAYNNGLIGPGHCD